MGKRTEYVVQIILYFLWAFLASCGLELFGCGLPIQLQCQNEIAITLIILVTGFAPPMVNLVFITGFAPPMVNLIFIVGLALYLIICELFHLTDYIELLTGESVIWFYLFELCMNINAQVH